MDRYQTELMSAVWCDAHRYALWAEIELAVLDAWCTQGTITPEDVRIIDYYWPSVDSVFIARCQDREQEVGHDVAAFVDVLEEAIAVPEGRWVHYGLTASDVVDTALALQLRLAGGLLVAQASRLGDALDAQYAHKFWQPCVGRTHGQHARAMAFGDKLAIWSNLISRATHRMATATQAVAVGKIAGPVGIHDTVPQGVEAQVLDTLGLTPVAGTQVISRDVHADFLFACAQLATACDLIATDLRLLSSSEIAEVYWPRSDQGKGSSSMPHKNNPTRLERITGLSRVVRSNVQVGLDDVVLWHERDISHSSAERIVLPESSQLTHYMLTELDALVRPMQVDGERMSANLEASPTGSADLLMAAVRHGTGRAAAYRDIQRNT